MTDACIIITYNRDWLKLMGWSEVMFTHSSAISSVHLSLCQCVDIQISHWACRRYFAVSKYANTSLYGCKKRQSLYTKYPWTFTFAGTRFQRMPVIAEQLNPSWTLAFPIKTYDAKLLTKWRHSHVRSLFRQSCFPWTSLSIICDHEFRFYFGEFGWKEWFSDSQIKERRERNNYYQIRKEKVRTYAYYIVCIIKGL